MFQVEKVLSEMNLSHFCSISITRKNKNKRRSFGPFGSLHHRDNCNNNFHYNWTFIRNQDRDEGLEGEVKINGGRRRGRRRWGKEKKNHWSSWLDLAVALMTKSTSIDDQMDGRLAFTFTFHLFFLLLSLWVKWN